MEDFLSGQKLSLFQGSEDELINSASSQGDAEMMQAEPTEVLVAAE